MNTDLEDIVNGLGKHFKSLDVDFFIVGAKARDIISKESGVELSRRKTSDVDFGLFVDSWDTLDAMRELFRNDENIELNPDKKNKVRYYYKGTPFDLVPFGGIEDADGKVSWPPCYDTIMTVIGYEEALKSAKVIAIGDTEVKVVTPEMLVALKIVSWDENPARDRDAQDINYIMENYENIDADVENCLFDHYLDILDRFEHDHHLSSLAIMGIRIARFASEEHIDLIKNVLNDSDQREKLARKMVSFNVVERETQVERRSSWVDALIYGMNYERDQIIYR